MCYSNENIARLRYGWFRTIRSLSLDCVVRVKRTAILPFKLDKEELIRVINFPSENVAVIGRKNTLQEIRESSSQIEEQFDKGLNLLNKYNKKIPINKAIKYKP